MVTIGIDATFLTPGRVGGAEFMVKNLVAGFGLLPTTAGTCFRIAAPEPWTQDPGIDWYRTTPGNRFFRGTQATWRMRGAIDALLAPNYFTPPTSIGIPTTTVIHDLQYVHFPNYFSARKRTWLRTSHLVTLRMARRVVVLSDWVRNDVLEWYGTRFEAKLVVIPNPISWRRFDASSGAPDSQEQRVRGMLPHANQGTGTRPKVLSVSAHWPHKNIATLLRAFRRLQDRTGDDGPELVLVGQLAPNLVSNRNATDLAAVVAQLGLRNVRVTGHIDDEALGEEYRSASLFVFPSLFEGFGMPPVEALGMGVPVLTTRKTSIPDVTLGLARYVDDALDENEWADSIEEMLKDPERHAPAAADIARVRAYYDPARIAGLYLDTLVT